jgi:trehalose 6-phosphate phosphatase
VRDILARANHQVLARVASSHVLLAFDYDGTLAPIVRDPDRAHMRERTRELLERVANAYPCVVISGRSQEDVQQRVSEAGVFEVIGNHGLEPRCPQEADAARVRAWMPSLERRLGRVPGVVIEDKVYSVSVHYRRARDRRKARRAILRAVSDLDGARVIGGKSVINLLPREGPHKGTALETAREQLRCDLALYVGDDETDEDVFALDDPQRLLTVRVRPKRTSRAAFYISNQKSVDVLLATLLQLREEHWRNS